MALPPNVQSDVLNTVLDTPPALNVLDENESDSSDDIETNETETNEQDITTPDSTEDVLCLTDFKRHQPMAELDVISGRYLFNCTPTGNRIYEIDGRRFRLKKDTVDRPMYTNKSPTSLANSKIDKTFVELLLLSIFSVSNLKKNLIDTDHLKIIEYFFKHRVGRDHVRREIFKQPNAVI